MNTLFHQNKFKLLQFTKLALLSGFVFFVVLFLGAAVVGWLYRDSIKDMLISKLNQGLRTEVFIRDISLNFFRSFPNTSISFNDVAVLEVSDAPVKDTLLTARKIHFQFNIIDLLRRNYAISRAEIARGKIWMKVFEDGSQNYIFWKANDQEDQQVSDLQFDLRRIVLTDMDFIYDDRADGHLISLSIAKAYLKGNFSLENYQFATEGKMQVNQLTIDDAFFLANQPMSFNFLLDVEGNEKFTFREGIFRVSEHAFLAGGSIDLSGQDLYLDLQIDAAQLSLENFIEDLPPQYGKYFDGFRGKGNFFLKCEIKGYLSSLLNPYVNAAFGISNGELFHRKANLRFEGISFNSTFNNGQRRSTQSSELIVNDFHAVLNNSQLRGKAKIFDFNQPQLDVQLFSDINAGAWQRFLQPEAITSANGELYIDVEFKGRLGENRNFTASHFMASKITGVIKATDLSFRLKNDPLNYNSIFADFRFNNNDILIERFEGMASTSHFNMKGFFRNVLPWLFFEKERLFVNASLISKNLNFNELLQHNVSGSDTIYKLHLSEMIDFRMSADVDNLTFRKFEAQNVKGTLSMKEQMFYASNVSLNAMKGRILASGYINGKSKDFLVMGCEASIVNVDVYDLFYQMGNFGQEAIEYDNLRGRITATASFISRWSPFLDIDWNSLEVTADVKVEDGELINYKPMIELSRFIRVGDLNHVKFSTLENQIRIKDKKIIIPDMEVNSSAINIKLSGEHTFDDRIDYRLQVLLSDLLARRNRESRNPQEQYGDIIDDGRGRTTLFLRITGTVDNPVFRYDTRAVRDKLREDLRQERQTLRQVLRTEFGLSNTDTLPDGTPVQPDQRQMERQEIRRGERGKFIIEWDD